MQIYEGRPAAAGNRMEKEMRVYELLDELGISYVRADHEAVMTIEACREVDEALQIEICKNLFLCNRQETEFYLLLIPGGKPFKTKYLSAQIGSSRLSFASGEDMEKYLNVTPGSATIMGLIFDPENKVQLLIDEEVLEEEYFACHPCINTSSLRFKTADLVEKLIPAMDHEPTMVKL